MGCNETECELLEEYASDTHSDPAPARATTSPDRGDPSDPNKEKPKRPLAIASVKVGSQQIRSNQPANVAAYRGTPKAPAPVSTPAPTAPAPANQSASKPASPPARLTSKPLGPGPRVQQLTETEALAISPTNKRQKVQKDTALQIAQLEADNTKLKNEIANLKADYKREQFYLTRSHQTQLEAEYQKGHAAGYIAGHTAAIQVSIQQAQTFAAAQQVATAQHNRNGYAERHARRQQEPQP